MRAEPPAVHGRAKKIDCALTIAVGGRPMKTVCEVLGVSPLKLLKDHARVIAKVGSILSKSPPIKPPPW